ncbi:MAG: Dabb family protein [Nitrospirota bacterium]|nr:Dabb family protein [Nitrospirota bacterium]
MLKHIVLFKLKPSAEGADKETNARKIKADLEALKSRIPQIRHLEVGINCIPGEAAYDVAIYSEFANEADLGAYAKHPEHMKIAEFVGKVRESRVAVDYLV